MDASRALYHLLLQRLRAVCSDSCSGRVASIQETLRVSLDGNQFILQAKDESGVEYSHAVATTYFRFYGRSDTGEATGANHRELNWQAAEQCLDELEEAMLGSAESHSFAPTGNMTYVPTVNPVISSSVSIVYCIGLLLAIGIMSWIFWGFMAGVLACLTVCPLLILGSHLDGKPFGQPVTRWEFALISAGVVVGGGLISILPSLIYWMLVLYSLLERRKDIPFPVWGGAGALCAFPIAIQPEVGVAFAFSLAGVALLSAWMTPWRVSWKNVIFFVGALILFAIVVAVLTTPIPIPKNGQLLTFGGALIGVGIMVTWWLYGTNTSLAFIGSLVILTVILTVSLLNDISPAVSVGSSLGLLLATAIRIVKAAIFSRVLQ